MDIADKAEQMPRLAVTPLWYEDWYDGVCSGICEYEGEKLWFTWINSDEKHLRVFAVVRINESMMAEFIRRHAIYREICGPHTDFNAPKCADGG